VASLPLLHHQGEGEVAEEKPPGRVILVPMLRPILVLTAFAGLWLAWSQNQQPAQLTIEKVTDTLWVIVGSGGNVAVMPTPQGVVLVDDKFAQDNPQIVAKVKSVTDQPIRYVLNTHHHGDHTGGNKALLDANAEIILHRNARANMVKGEQPGLPRITFSDETQVFLGGKEVVARYFGRGHTNGDAFVYFPALKVLHTGDMMMNGLGFPFVDLSSGGNVQHLLVSLDQLIAMIDADTVIIPGHGALARRADLIAWRGMIATAVGRVKALKDAGQTLDQAKAAKPLAGLSNATNGFVGDDAFVESIWGSLEAHAR